MIIWFSGGAESAPPFGLLFYFGKLPVYEFVPCVGLDAFAVHDYRFPLFDVVVIGIFLCDYKDCAETAANHNVVAACQGQTVGAG